jgi:release factor glutamine methyltransferase
MEDKAFLELGAGSGLLSLIVAKRGARVTATDISTIAIQALDINSVYNQVQIQIVRSDVFQDITHQPFDIIAVNPPYYPKDPSSEQELAWYCGSEYQFFHKFFGSLPNFIHSQTQVIMVLSEVAPKGDVRNICHSYGFKMIEKETKKVLWEKQSIYHCQ